MEDLLIETIEYRGYHIDIYLDDYGQCFYCNFEGETISFGTYNTNYEEDVHYLIDEKLDTIKYFDEPFIGAKLLWFENGYSGHRDIQLKYRSRIIKIWLVEESEKVVIDSLIKESEVILAKLIKNYEKNKVSEIVSN